jgi:hypothetical protein
MLGRQAITALVPLALWLAPIVLGCGSQATEKAIVVPAAPAADSGPLAPEDARGESPTTQGAPATDTCATVAAKLRESLKKEHGGTIQVHADPIPIEGYCFFTIDLMREGGLSSKRSRALHLDGEAIRDPGAELTAMLTRLRLHDNPQVLPAHDLARMVNYVLGIAGGVVADFQAPKYPPKLEKARQNLRLAYVVNEWPAEFGGKHAPGAAVKFEVVIEPDYRFVVKRNGKPVKGDSKSLRCDLVVERVLEMVTAADPKATHRITVDPVVVPGYCFLTIDTIASSRNSSSRRTGTRRADGSEILDPRGELHRIFRLLDLNNNPAARAPYELARIVGFVFAVPGHVMTESHSPKRVARMARAAGGLTLSFYVEMWPANFNRKTMVGPPSTWVVTIAPDYTVTLTRDGAAP